MAKTKLIKPFTKLAALLLAIVALLHEVRVILNIDLTVGTFEVPIWVSAGACIITLLLSIGLWRESY